MVYNTHGIVLRAVKYGETSLIVTVFTEKFGKQSYIVNGVRSSKKGSNKSSFYQPGALLDLEVYHNDIKSIHRIKEVNWQVLYQHIFSDVIRNSVAIFMVEVLQRIIRQPESNPDLFYFCVEAFENLDKANNTVVSNIPLFFALQLPYFFGFRMQPAPASKQALYLNLTEGTFSLEEHKLPNYLTQEDSAVTAELLKVLHINDLEHFKLNSATRNRLLNHYMHYYSIHVQEFGNLKSLPILQQLLS